MKKKIAIIGIVVLICLSLVACSNSAQEKDNATKDSTVMFTDSVGREVELPQNIDRIISTGPLSQIILFALAPDSLVGIADPWSEETKPYIDSNYYDLPVLGSLFGGEKINTEELIATKPDVIVDIGEAKDSIKKDMDDLEKQTGIPVIHLNATTATMADTYRALGKLLKCEAEGEVLASYCEKTYADTLTLMNEVGAENKTSVVYCLGADGLNVLTENSYHAEILNLVANNGAKVDSMSAKGTGTAIDMEQLLLWNPEVILFAQDSIYDTVATDPVWQNLKAIKSGNYYEVPSAPYNWMGFPPSVQRYLGMMWMEDLLYPEKVNFDLYDEVCQFYKLFYHYDLTKDQFNELTVNSMMTK